MANKYGVHVEINIEQIYYSLLIPMVIPCCIEITNPNPSQLLILQYT